jgi:prepilin-type N-terminal cleavage/methylation domain-containing protein
MKTTFILPMPHRRIDGFTLIEILVVVVVGLVLAAGSLVAFTKIKEKANCVRCAGQMRQIGAAALTRAGDNNGRIYTREEIGNSSYRSYDDSLSLCQLLDPYLSDKEIWMSPGAHPRLAPFENSYAWSRAGNLTDGPLATVANPGNTVLLWNNHTFTMPSAKNVPEGSNGGPRNARSSLYYYPWKSRTALNWLYLDGRVETR